MARHRIPNATESLIRTRRSLGDGTISGRSRLATPAVSPVRGGSTVISSPAPRVGQHITVEGETDIPSGGAFLEFEVLVPEVIGAGFSGTTLTTDELVVEVDGYYDLHLDLRWLDNYRGGGRITVFVNDRVIQVFESAKGNGGRVVVPLGVMEAGVDAAKVFVEHFDG